MVTEDAEGARFFDARVAFLVAVNTSESHRNGDAPKSGVESHKYTAGPRLKGLTKNRENHHVSTVRAFPLPLLTR